MMEEELDVGIDALPFDVHLDSLAGGIENLIFFYQNALSFDFSTPQSLESIALNEVVPEHFDVELTSLSNTMIDIRETF
jgi:hypothetical protein